MNALKNRNALFILLCLLAIAVIYAVDIFPIAYNLTGWSQFGDLPIQPSRLAYFQADTPNIISYREPGAAEPVTCAEAVAYLESAGGGITRCCQTETKVSCLAGDFSPEIPSQDEACVRTLRAAFNVPETLPGVKEFHVYAECPEGGNPQMTVVQMDSGAQIAWKTLTMYELSALNIALRCLVAPLLLGLAIRVALPLLRKPDPSRQIRRL